MFHGMFVYQSGLGCFTIGDDEFHDMFHDMFVH